MHEQLLCDWIAADPLRMHALRLAAQLDLPDWCIGAGFVRNLAWDRLHRYATPTPLTDIDLIYFDPRVDARRDAECEAVLRAADASLPWSVRNQARMHEHNGDLPYRSTADAMRYWVEMETAVGVRLEHCGRLHIIAPFGLHSLFALQLTPNESRGRRDAFLGRLRTKNWLTVWPQLRIIKG